MNGQWMKGGCSWMNYIHDDVDNVTSNDVGGDASNDVNVGHDVNDIIHNITSPFLKMSSMNNDFGLAWVSTMAFNKCVDGFHVCSFTS